MAVLLNVAVVSSGYAQEVDSDQAGPKDQADQEEQASQEDVLLQLEVFLNDAPLHLLAPFLLSPDGRLSTSKEDLREIGLAVPDSLDSDLDVALQDLPGVTYRYDDAAQAIYITAPPDKLLRRDLDPTPPAPPRPTRPPLGMILNYAVNVSGSEKEGGGSFYDGVQGLFDARVFGRFGLLESSQLARWPNSRDAEIIRLESRYLFENPRHLRTFVAGDTLTGGLTWTRPVRMAGVQLRRNFGQRPDLVTVPVARFTGTAAVPSTAELLLDQRPLLRVDAPPGPFEISLPAFAYGRGDATLVLTDPTGRRFTTVLPFYSSPVLLARGLTDYSVELGVARRSFGFRSSDYDDKPFVSGTVRRGVSNRITVQGHLEAAEGMALAGVGGVFNVANQFLVSASVAGSTADDGRGGLVELAVERRTRRFSLYLRTQRTSGDLTDLASYTARRDGSFSEIVGPPARIDQASISAALPGRASIGLNYFSAYRETTRSRIATLSFNKSFRRVSFYANAAYDFDDDDGASFFVGLSVPLGGSGYAEVGAARARDDSYGFVEASRWDLNATGDWGVAARLAAGDRREGWLRLGYLTPAAELEALAEHVDGSNFARIRAEGSVSFVARDLHFARRSYDSYAVVRVGQAGVPVLQENRLVGRTNKRGLLLVPNLTAFSPNRIAVDPTDLSVDVELAGTETLVAPFSRVPVLVDFTVRNVSNAALVVLVDPTQAPLPVGSVGRRDGDLETFAVGYDGEAWINRLEANNRVVVTTPDGAECEASFTYQRRPGEQVRIGPVVCRPTDGRTQ